MTKYKEWKNKFKKEDGAGAGAGGGDGGGAVAANNVGSGNIAGVGVGPAGEPGVTPKTGIIGQGFGKEKKKKKLTGLSIDGMIKTKIKENNDNNNVVLKQVLDGLDKVDVVVDTMNTTKKEIKVVQEQIKKSFKEKYYVGKSND
jgi:hypothetical protein